MEPRSTTADHDGRSAVTEAMTSGEEMISPADLRRYLGESESGHRGETTSPESPVEIIAARAARMYAMRGCRLHRAVAPGVQRPRRSADPARRAGTGACRTR